MTEPSARVVIVGGGFGGLAAARALGKAPTQNIVIDRTNHRVFQPLLYQVATSVLGPAQISSPIRSILRKQKNTTVIMGEVTGVDKEQRCVFVNDADREHVPVPYDYLVLATGVWHSYFGHDEFEQFAPGLKSLADAVLIRNRILQAFLGQSSLRVSVFVQWMWTYVTGQRGSRLIVNHHASACHDTRSTPLPERQPVGTR